MALKPGYCTLCRSRCGTLNLVENDRLIAVQPNPEHPTGASMCLKGRAAPELVESAERLLYPMRRTQPKGAADPGWVRISWDEALDEIAGRMAAIKARRGAEAFAFSVTTPSGTPLSDSIDWIERLIRRYGSPNTSYATEICNWHKDVAHAFTFGCGIPTPDYRNAGLILLWGHNPSNTWLAQAQAIADGRQAGARLLVIDPRETALAREADVWLRVKPGSDAALAMGLANLLIESGRFDLGFIERWSNAALLVREDTGRFLRASDLDASADTALLAWDETTGGPRAMPKVSEAWPPMRVALRGRFAVMTLAGPVDCRPVFDRYREACAAFTPGLTAELTWVPEDELQSAATLIAEAGSVAYHAWSGVGQQRNASQTERAIACLYALTGSFDAPGGNRQLGKAPARAVNGLDLIDPVQQAKALGLAQRPLGPPAQGWIMARDLYRAILEGEPYRIEGLLAFGSNPLSSQADSALGAQALAALEFYAHCDLFINPTARYADILLPVNTPWEREGLRIGFEISEEAQEHVQLRQQMVPSRGEARSDNDIVFALANRLGMTDDFFGGTLEQGWNAMLEPLGLSVGQLRENPEGLRVPLRHESFKYRRDGFATPTGRVELYSERLLEHGYPPLPECPPPPAEDARFPLLLTSAKNGYFCHSQHRNLTSLRRKAPAPTLSISTALARAQGIAEDDWVRLTTAMGSARFQARLDQRLHPRVVVGEFGWWQRNQALGLDETPLLGPGNSHYNGLATAEHADPLSGSVPLRDLQCNLRREAPPEVVPARWSGMRDFIVAERHAEAEGVSSVSLRATDGGLLPDYQPGQHITLRIHTAVHGEQTRAYSLTGAAVDPTRRLYHIAVRHARGQAADGRPWSGKLSSHINQTLAIGDRVEVQAPSGTFLIPAKSQRPLVFYAGGIGITPFISALESAASQGFSGDILLLYGNRNGAGHAFKERLRELGRRLPGLRCIDVYSAPLADERLGVDYQVLGNVTRSLVPDVFFARRALHYLCGPQVMMEALIAELEAAGVPRFDIFNEVFRSPPTPPSGHSRFAVTFARSGQTHEWNNEAGPLLTFAERLGIQLPSGCRVGQCESCAVRVLEGEVVHLHGKEPQDPRVCLSCQAIPATTLTLDA
ncbi:molybdopterin-dependent oxidoreductase [Phytopseudomonas dryadis]|uniref:Ferredoxin:oxidoreductase FAD/NAD(P)-binding protein n=1 Tax=Phytopseudomonas dryadis TaxID=2487520 RepID=A0A4Q9QZV2_9GAMM|nr:molybdopterin-dependent oxidoreductase [Pseudomonas dryadis]TBU90317.1 ferredoxin:oxidoreductase FAD/NAD(P)-binding protein [Pseudomonas dryadis]